LFLSKLALQPIRFILDDEKIRLEYLSINLKRIKKAKEAQLKDIKEFSDYSPGNSIKLKFYFYNYMTFELIKHEFICRNDDFEVLVSDLKKLNKSSSDIQSNNQNRRPAYWDFFKSNEAKFWFILSIIASIAAIVIAIISQKLSVLALLVLTIPYIFKYLSNK